MRSFLSVIHVVEPEQVSSDKILKQSFIDYILD